MPPGAGDQAQLLQVIGSGPAGVDIVTVALNAVDDAAVDFKPAHDPPLPGGQHGDALQSLLVVFLGALNLEALKKANKKNAY